MNELLQETKMSSPSLDYMWSVHLWLHTRGMPYEDYLYEGNSWLQLHLYYDCICSLFGVKFMLVYPVLYVLYTYLHT